MACAYFDGEKKIIPSECEKAFLVDGNAAVITVDLTSSHLYFPDSKYFPKDGKVIQKANHFLDCARKYHMPVLHVRMTPDMSFQQNYAYLWPISFGDVSFDIPENTFSEFSVRTEPTDIQCSDQKRLNIFCNTQLEKILRSLHVERIFILGSMTDCTVLASAFGAADCGFRTVVIQDLCAGTEHLEEAALRMMSLHCALVADSESILAYWEKA